MNETLPAIKVEVEGWNECSFQVWPKIFLLKLVLREISLLHRLFVLYTKLLYAKWTSLVQRRISSFNSFFVMFVLISLSIQIRRRKISIVSFNGTLVNNNFTSNEIIWQLLCSSIYPTLFIKSFVFFPVNSLGLILTVGEQGNWLDCIRSFWYFEIFVFLVNH